jgi:hypothetical protein
MRTVSFAAIIIGLCAVVAVGQKPKTVDDAIQVLKTRWLKPKDLDWILHNPKDQVVWTLYRPFGTGVRNEFGLWGDNQALRDSCGDNNPEGCSVVIFNRLWESVRADADPTLVRQLDCQFQLAEAIHINYTGFYRLTTGELIKAMQSQIDDQLARLAKTGTPMCQSSLALEAAGKPDMKCFVDASFAKNRADQAKEATLEMVLGWLGLRNFFMASHLPPKIILNFSRKCQFPTPPYLYAATAK